jgi:DNA invertase Pin-like site-specific DNA recombinase
MATEFWKNPKPKTQTSEMERSENEKITDFRSKIETPLTTQYKVKQNWLKMRILVLRKLFSKNMIRPALAERIIKRIKIFRKRFKSLMDFLHFAFKGHVASCLFLICFLISLQSQGIFLSYLLGVFLLGFVAQNDHENKTKSQKTRKTDNKSRDVKIRRTATKEEKDDSLLQVVFPSIDKIERFGKEGITVAIYIRVSTAKQAKEGKSLKAQERELRDVAKKIGASRAIFLIDAGKSGKDFSSRKLGIIVALAATGKIDRLIVSEIDRVGRKSLKLLGFLLQLRGYGVLIVTPTGELDLEKLADLVMTTVKAFGAEEQNELRGHYALRSKVQAFKNRVWNLPVPLGYQKKKQWIEKKSRWDSVIKDIFDLFLRHKNYRLTADIANKLYSSILEKPLTRQQIKQILENPVYMGKPGYFGEVVNRKFGEVVVNDPNLAYVTEKTFEKARKIVSVLSRRYQRRENELEELIANCGLDILDYLPDVALLCPDCRSKMVRNGEIYICQNCRRQLRAIKKTAIERIREWALKRDKAVKTIMRIYKRYKKKKKKWQNKDLERVLKEIEEDDDSHS